MSTCMGFMPRHTYQAETNVPVCKLVIPLRPPEDGQPAKPKVMHDTMLSGNGLGMKVRRLQWSGV